MLWHSSWSNFYPSPFVDVSRIELQKVLINAGGMTLAFLVICLVLIGINRMLSPKTGPHSSVALKCAVLRSGTYVARSWPLGRQSRSQLRALAFLRDSRPTI